LYSAWVFSIIKEISAEDIPSQLPPLISNPPIIVANRKHRLMERKDCRDMVKKLQPQPLYGPEDIGTPINLDNLQSAITRACHELGLPVEVSKDEMREDGMLSKKIPCIVVPVDQKEGLITTILPPYIDKKTCTLCGDCVSVCMFDAINPPKIDKKSCTYCGKCEGICKYNAIRIGEEIELYIRKIDADNAKKLEEIENIKTTSHPYNISVRIQKMIKKES